MSKIYSSIQKAIEKSRGNQMNSPKKRAKQTSASNKNAGGVSTGIFRMLPFAIPSEEVMEESRIVAATDDRSARTAYNVLRTRLLQRMRSNNWRSLLVTSPGPGEGKTLTAANLSMSIARDVNQSAILVDLDLLRPSVAGYLGINANEINAGVGDYLQGNAKLNDILYSPGDFDRLALVPNRERIENSSDLIGSPRMKDLVSDLQDQAGQRSLVIYDMPPVLVCDDVLALAPSVDAILLVVGQGVTDRAALETTISMLSEYNILGIVLNMSEEKQGGGSYGLY